MPNRLQPEGTPVAPRTVWPVIALGALALLLWYLRDILLLGFTSVLIAIALRVLADRLSRLTRAPPWLGLALVVILVVGFLAGAIVLFGWRIADQFDAIVGKAQASMRALVAFAGQHAWSRFVISKLSGANLGGATVSFAPALGSVLGSTGQALAYSAIVIASGVFLAIDPDRHVRGLLLLAPQGHRAEAEEFLSRSGAILRKWMWSRLIVMLAVGVLSSLGLWLLGIDGAFTLGITGGMLTFIPLVGALMAAVPAVLVALAQSPLLAVYTAVMYWAVHFIEGTFITPYVQDEEVDLPPVVTMYSTLVFTALFGASGIFLASPLALMAILVIQMFYVEPGERGEGPARRIRSAPEVSSLPRPPATPETGPGPGSSPRAGPAARRRSPPA
jgi:predicted PurR-regulated permease PerM